MKPSIAILISILFICSCHSKSLYKKQSDLHVIFGSGGGFTGATEQHELLGKGELLKISISGDTTHLGKISKQQKRYLSTLINSDSLSKISYNNYANMTSFIYIKVKDNSVYSFHWSSNPSTFPRPLYQLDSFLNTLVK
jgi:hypothetical protein